ncbi:Cephalosporin-C deacetylase [compost metagenome]
MSFMDKKLQDLYNYSAINTAPADLDEFWTTTLDEANERPLNDHRDQQESLSPYMDVYKVTYEGFDETPIHGWYLLPRFTSPGSSKEQGLPCVVLFHGYTGGKGTPENYANWLLMGYAVFAIDIRGQAGETGNALPQQYGMTKGWITQGLLDPAQCYYRAITVDAIKAVEWVSRQVEVDPTRIIVAGGSQGGGLALITGALSNLPSKVIADIPNMCHMDFGIFNSTGSLTEAASFVSRYPEHLKQVLHTLSYFDLLNLSDRLKVPTLVSVSLKDPICMPETIFAVYNQLHNPKELHIFPFNGHHTSGDHFRNYIEFIRKP